MERTTLSIKFCTIGMESARVQMYILTGPFFKKKLQRSKEDWTKENLLVFTASNGWLDSSKQTYGVREKRLCGEADEVYTITIEAWIEQLPELSQDYEPGNILNLDELGLFFKALSEKGPAEKTKKSKSGKKSKQRTTVMFIIAPNGSFVFEPTVIWRSKLPRCFKSLKNASKPMSMHYFSNKKACMNSEVMESILQRLDRRMNQKNEKLSCFWTMLHVILKLHRPV